MDDIEPICTVEAPLFPAPTRLPVNGFNGSLHSVVFWAPSYRSSLYQSVPFSVPMTWTTIDDYGLRIVGASTVTGACLGLVLTTLLFVLLATPREKRWKIFHTSLLGALTSQLVYSLVLTIQSSTSGLGRFPAYRWLTFDTTTTISEHFLRLYTAQLVINLISTGLILLCLFLQTTSLLKTLGVLSTPIRNAISAYLILASVLYIVVRILDCIFHIHTFTGPNYSSSFDDSKLKIVVTAAKTLALTSFCAGNLILVMYRVFSRSILVQDDSPAAKRAQRSLAILATTMLTSLVVPLTLAIMALVPTAGSKLFDPDELIMPCILVILPLGVLFDTDGDNARQPAPQVLSNTSTGKAPGHAATAGQPCGTNDFLTELGTGDEGIPSTRASKTDKPAPSQTDRELQEIDAL